MDESNNKLMEWFINQDTKKDIVYDIIKHEVHCYLPIFYDEAVNFKQESCRNPLTCKLMQDVLRRNNFGNLKVTYCDPNNESEVTRCVKTKMENKAVYMCTAYQQGILLGSPKSFCFTNIHYLAFDEAIYHSIEPKPPKTAIIKIKNLGPNQQTIIHNQPVEFSFYCEAHSFFFEEGIQWLYLYRNGTQRHVPSDLISNYVDNSPRKYEEYPNPSSSVNILVPDTKIRGIICAAPRLSILENNNYREWEYEQMNISVYDAIAPFFVETESKVSFIIGEKNKEIKCQANGLPTPVIQWTAMSGQNFSEEDIIDLSLYSVLKFPTYDSVNEGDYMCTATNEVGNVSKIFSVRTSSIVSTLPIDQLAFLLTGIIGSLILAFAATFYWYFRKMKMKQSLEMDSILKLLNGVAPNLESEKTTNPLQIPYDRKWELDKHSFCIDESKILGFGEFGIVYKGTIAKLNIDAAFKSLKWQGNMTHLKSLVSELKLLLYIDKHSNIVELFGAYTQEIEKGIIYVAIEFCALGSLESHLRSNKGTFQKCPILTSYFEETSSVRREEELILSEPTIYSIKSLLKWCSEISQAMDYLYSKKVLHGDLATRNILLTADWTAKLTDFGLSRKLYNSDQYVKKGQDPLPWRWLALESLISKVFNVKTDVWAFGITMWEIFSFGDTPYPGLSATMEFVDDLENGLRNPKPKYASQELYEVMMACWNGEPDERPSFSSLGLLFQNSFRHPSFQVNVEEMEVFGPNEGGIEYLELEEL